MNDDPAERVPPESGSRKFWGILFYVVVGAFVLWLIVSAVNPSPSICDSVEAWERAACERTEQAERPARY